MGEWRRYRKIALVQAKQMDVAFGVETLEGTMKGEPGDYLCKAETGERWPVKRRIFEATYEEVEEI